MKTYPLPSLSLDEAMELQFKAVDSVTRHFDGYSVLSLGDMGIPLGLGKPECTCRVEQVFADVFGAERALLVRGAGTGAIRWPLASMVKPGDAVLVHNAPSIRPRTLQ